MPMMTAVVVQPKVNEVSGFNRLVNKVWDPSDKNLKLKIFLFIVSLFIIGAVSTTWYFYHKKVLQAKIGRGIRIVEEERILHLANPQGQDKLVGVVGQHIPKHLMPYDCQHLFKEASICLKWKYRAKLKIFRNYTSEDVQCFRVDWTSYTEPKLKDCFDIGGSSWYGIGESYPQFWPMNKWEKIRSPLVTGNSYRNAFGSVLERYMLTSSGVGILVDADVPLHVSINEDSGKVCFESSFDSYPYRKMNASQLPFLRYNLCASRDIKTVHTYMARRYFSRHVDNPLSTYNDYFVNPVWSTQPKLNDYINDSTLLGFTHKIIQKGYKPGILVINRGWEENIGDLQFDTQRFPSAENTLISLRNKGFSVVLTASPYVSIKSSNFDMAMSSSYFIFDSQQSTPLLTNWRDNAVAILDFSNEEAQDWLRTNLMLAMTDYTLDGLSFVGGQSMYLPFSYNMLTTYTNPDYNAFQYSNFSINSNFDLAMMSSSVFRSIAVKTSNSTPCILKLSPRRPDWSYIGGLKSIIPSVLTQGLFGNVYINVGSVGGDQPGIKSDRELYIRWMQLSIFMPIFQFSVAPFDFDPEVEKIATKLLKIRKKTVIPYFKKYLEESFEAGFPLIRPLWWLSPHDDETYTIDDQFLVHDNIVVAPVVTKGQSKRNIYLPEGWWRDELSGTIRRGKKWIYNYEVKIDQVPYFLWLEGAPIR